MSAKRVLSVGQCFADQGAVARAFGQHFAAEVEAASTAAEALDRLRQGVFHLVLVNRLLDADGSSGVEVVRQIRADDIFRQVPIMLVSNYPEAQREAVEAGAVPGFGKAALGQAHMLARVRPYLGEEQ